MLKWSRLFGQGYAKLIWTIWADSAPTGLGSGVTAFDGLPPIACRWAPLQGSLSSFAPCEISLFLCLEIKKLCFPAQAREASPSYIVNPSPLYSLFDISFTLLLCFVKKRVHIYFQDQTREATPSYIVHPTSYIVHPTSYIVNRTSYILHRTSYIVHRTS